MASIGWSLLVVTLLLITQAKCESTAFPVIPKHLHDCYKNDGLYHRANRMPSTFESFLDLLRKVEGSPTSRNMNARELSLALLQYLKLDGIQSTQSHLKYFNGNILPFAPSGPEYFKHRLMLVGLLPRIDAGYMKAINETLTKKEMCDLHFMLSYSIDPYKRSDERCSPLYEESRRRNDADGRSDWDVRDYYRRHRRHINNEERFNGVKTGGREMVFSGKSTQKSLERTRRNGEKERKSEVEEIPVLENAKASQEQKDKFTIGTQELLSDGEQHREAGLQSLVQARNFGSYGGRPFGRPSLALDESPISGVIPGIPLSDCPVVNGVITTPFGSLTIGTVIAGIAAGLNPEEIPPTKLSVDQQELESHSDRVKNLWASTLAGTVADIISSSAFMDAETLILKGGWNDSSDPKWYLLNNNDFQHLPEVALRGSMDGFLLGANAREWTNKFPGFKLSQMLQIYYDCLWGDLGAKNRVQLRSKYAPDEDFRKQTLLMSLVLKKQKMQSLTILDYNPIVRIAVTKVTQHMQAMDVSEKSYIGSFLSKKIDNSVNMIAVVDSSWGQENLYKIFEVLRNAQVASTIGNNLTIVCGKDGKILMSSDNSVDTYNLFTKDMLVENCTRGFDLPLIIDRLDPMYRKIFHDEKNSGKMVTSSQVVVLFPFEPFLQDNSYVVEKSKNFADTFPDVRLMVASSVRVDSFLPLVRNPKDLFLVTPPSADPELRSAKAFGDGVKQSFHRLSRPSCGSYFDDDTQGTETQVTRDVSPGYIAYYRLLPQYFYTQRGQVIVTVRSRQRAPLMVCHSREEERPVGPTPRGDPVNDYDSSRMPDYRTDFPPEASPYGRQTDGEPDGLVMCKTITSETYKIEMSNPCDGASSIRECRPLYISLYPPLQETIRTDCPNCRLPINVQYEITAAGLTCYNSAAIKFASPILLSFLLIRHFFM